MVSKITAPPSIQCKRCKKVKTFFWSSSKFEARIYIANSSAALDQNHLMKPAFGLKSLPSLGLEDKFVLICKVYARKDRLFCFCSALVANSRLFDQKLVAQRNESGLPQISKFVIEYTKGFQLKSCDALLRRFKTTKSLQYAQCDKHIYTVIGLGPGY